MRASESDRFWHATDKQDSNQKRRTQLKVERESKKCALAQYVRESHEIMQEEDKVIS